MERRVFFLCLLSFLLFAEGLSWLTAGGLGPCLVEPEHSQEATNDNKHEDCPTFFAGTLLSFERGFDWVKRDDNDKGVVAGFTVVLAISTIGLWLATNKLWVAGEKQLRLSGYTAGISASAINVTREIGEAQVRAYVSIKSVKVYFGGGDGLPFVEIVAFNSGQSPALDFIWAPEIFYLSETHPEKVREPHEEWASQPGIDIHSNSPSKALYCVDDFVLEEQIAIDDVVRNKIAVSVIIHFNWRDVFENSFEDVASFAGMAVKGDARQNQTKIHPLNSSPWSCSLQPIARGHQWSGIAVQAPVPQESDADETGQPSAGT